MNALPPGATPKEFSQRPLVVGTITGLRAFKVDRLGRLTGHQLPTVWTPGENVAVCRRQDGTLGAAAMRYVSQVYGSGGMISGPPIRTSQPPPWVSNPACMCPLCTGVYRPDAPRHEVEAPSPKPAHDLVSLTCSCGFWAYFDGTNAYKDTVSVTGIIEGYGRVVAGTRGFRAEKARIVALVRPGAKHVDALRFAKVEHVYPDVPVYDRRVDALAAHPVVNPHPPVTPETCDDFWTRPA